MNLDPVNLNPVNLDDARSSSAPPSISATRRVWFMVCLIIAGEAVFALPFHVARFFRPTVLEVFSLTNIELGAAQAVYGVVAMLVYFPGGLLADRFSTRGLLSSSLILTALGGVYLATLPPKQHLWMLFGFWGVTTILLFWAALIRATRQWGGSDQQGRAYGVLDGGRGLFAAVLAAAMVWLFRTMMPDNPTTATDAERNAALRTIIYAYSAATLGAGVLCAMFVPSGRDGSDSDQTHAAATQTRSVNTILAVLRRPTSWLQALIVLCAYVGYKGIDNYSLYAAQGYGMSEVDAAQVTAVSAWVRPIAAVGAGLLADRIAASRVSLLGFVALVLCYAWLALVPPRVDATWVLLANVVVTCFAVFGLRGVYFALFQEAALPFAATGTAIGFVSVIGYTPDVFVHLVGGWLLDRSPGIAGHQHFFVFLAMFATLGAAASLAFGRVVAHQRAVRSSEAG